MYFTGFYTSKNDFDLESQMETGHFYAVKNEKDLSEEEKILEDKKIKWPKTVFEKAGEDIIFNPLKPPLPKQNFTYESKGSAQVCGVCTDHFRG